MWHEFSISLMDVIQIDGDTVNMQYSGIMAKARIDLTTIKRYYATKQGDNKAVLLVFDDGENMLVFDSWAEVNQAMRPITNI